MSLFRRTEKRSAQPVSILQLLGLFKDGLEVSESKALERSIAVSRAASVVAGTVGSLPLKAYRGSEENRKEVPSSLLTTPHRDLTAFEWRELVTLHLATWGNAYLAVELNGAGLPVYLDPLQPARVTPKRVAATDANPAGKVFEVVLDDGSAKQFTSAQILHIPGLGYDGLRGLGPVGVARQGISAGLAAEKYALKLWESGALQSGFLKAAAEMTQEQALLAKERFQQQVAGLQNAGEVAVLGGGMEFEPSSIPPEDAQFMQARAFQTKEIYSLFGLDENGVPKSSLDFLKFTVGPYLHRIEERVSRLLPRGQFAEFTVEGLLRSDIALRYGAYAVGKQNGWLSVNEIRSLENLPSIGAEGDAHTALAPNTGTPNAHPDPNPSN